MGEVAMKRRVLSILLIWSMTLMLLPGTAWAASNAQSEEAVQLLSIATSGKCGDNATWSLDASGTLTISGTGAMYDYDDVINYTPWLFRTSDIKNIEIESGITRIGDCAFQETQITTLVIPDTVESIGMFAFYDCGSLRWLDIPSSVTEIGYGAFSKCRSLYTVSLPTALQCIAASTFKGCSSLFFIDIPASVQSVEKDAFETCYHLVHVYFSGSEAQWEALSIADGNDHLSESTIFYDQCTLVYDPNGGVDNMWNSHTTVGEPFILLNCSHKAPEGQKFKAWYIDGKEYQPGDVYTFSANTTIQTLWTEADYSIDTLSASNGTVRATITSEYDSARFIVAVYTAEGKLAGLSEQLVSSADSSVTFQITPTDHAYRIKVFCLDSTGELYPRSLSETRFLSAA
jgi:hypothetical protein